jgi:hypothetical protein
MSDKLALRRRLAWKGITRANQLPLQYYYKFS